MTITKATTALEALQCAREFLSDENHWHKGTFANIYEEGSTSSEVLDRLRENGWEGAKCCSLGALRLCTAGDPYPDDLPDVYYDAQNALDSAARALGSGSVVGLNDRDTTTHQDVLDMFDRAIEQLTVKG